MTLKSFLLFVIPFFFWGEPLIADGKLVIHSNAPGASVFLDGNDLAKTDVSGNLTIDRLPDGNFSIVLKKSGFLSSQSEVEISADKTLVLYLELAPTHPSGGTPDAARNHPKSRILKENVPRQPDEVEVQATVTDVQNSQGTEAFPSAEQGHILVYAVSFFCTLGSMLVILLLVKRRKVFTSSFKNSSPRTEASITSTGPVQDSIPASSPSKESVERDSLFLAELEHREELLRAGFVSEDNRKARPRKPSDPSTITLDKNEYEVKN